MHAGYINSLPPRGKLSRVATQCGIEDGAMSSNSPLQRAMARKASWCSPLGSLPPLLPEKLPSSFTHEFISPSLPHGPHHGTNNGLPTAGMESSFEGQVNPVYLGRGLDHAAVLPLHGGFQQVHSQPYESVPHAVHLSRSSSTAAGQPFYPSYPHEAGAGPSQQSADAHLLWANVNAGYADQQGLTRIPSATSAMSNTWQPPAASWLAMGFSCNSSQPSIPTDQAQGSDGRLQNSPQVSQSPHLQQPHGADAMTKPLRGNKHKGENIRTLH